MTFPQDPVAAATHPDPYAYYKELVAGRPLYYDNSLGFWIASSAEAVEEVLTSPLCRVRPAEEPVPKALLGTPAGEIYRHFIRMNDGDRHCPFRQAVSAALSSLDTGRVAEESAGRARDLAEDPESFALDLPVSVMGGLIGVPEDTLPQTAMWMRDFARCIAPPPGPVQSDLMGRGKVAAERLLEMFRALFTPLESRQGGGLLWALAREAGRLGCDERDVIIANAIGLLFQPYEATAGLIGNTLLALNRNRGLRQLVAAEPDLLRDVILEVLRYDSPVQNTRRFVGEDGIVAEHPMKAGDTILVVLAAANRDPAANPNPEQFEMNRKGRRTFTFGVGAHACPGETLAVAIAKAGVEHLIASGVAYGLITDPARYRASANTRVPLLGRPARVECG